MNSGQFAALICALATSTILITAQLANIGSWLQKIAEKDKK